MGRNMSIDLNDMELCVGSCVLPNGIHMVFRRQCSMLDL